jgi:hypothetical protein
MAAADTYGKDITQVGPARNAAAVTPSDSADLGNVTRALWIGVAGNVAVTMSGGQNVTFIMPAGGPYPVSVSRVLATGTTATGIVAIW